MSDDFDGCLAIRGIQNRREYYTVMMTLENVAKMLKSPDEAQQKEWAEFGGVLPMQFRRQRRLSGARAIKLYRYLMDAAITRTSYVLPSLTCVIDARITFKPFADGARCGNVWYPKDAPWLVVDGQHRVAAIKRVWASDRSGFYEKKRLTKTQRWAVEYLVAESIPVTVFHDSGYERAQQMFADINRNVSKPSRELLDAFDHRRKATDDATV